MPSAPMFLRGLPKELVCVSPVLELWWVQHSLPTRQKSRCWLIDTINSLPPRFCTEQVDENARSLLPPGRRKELIHSYSIPTSPKLPKCLASIAPNLEHWWVRHNLVAWKRTEAATWGGRCHWSSLIPSTEKVGTKQMPASPWRGKELVKASKITFQDDL